MGIDVATYGIFDRIYNVGHFGRHIIMNIAAILGFVLAVASSAASASAVCPPATVDAKYGPFDYTDPDAKANRLPIVEKGHFKPQVEQLIRGESSDLGSDIDYVLRSFPNHHRALNSMSLLALREKTDRPDHSHFTVDCYFQRAIGFVPGDAIVHLLYGNYLYQVKKEQEALEQYQQAENLDPENPNILYNAGLLYFGLKQYDKALMYAKKAYASGFPLPGLRLKLQKAGQWKDD